MIEPARESPISLVVNFQEADAREQCSLEPFERSVLSIFFIF